MRHLLLVATLLAVPLVIARADPEAAGTGTGTGEYETWVEDFATTVRPDVGGDNRAVVIFLRVRECGP